MWILLAAAAVVGLSQGPSMIGRAGAPEAGLLESARSEESRADAPVALAFEPTVAQEPAPSVEEPEADEPRILVSLKNRRLWFVKGRDTLLSAPVAIGKGEDFVFEGKKYHFATPRGQRTVLAKVSNPVWLVPEWHYFEKAVRKDLEVIKLDKDSKVELADGSFIVVMGDSVGRVNERGYFAPFTPGVEIIFDGKIFMPPMNTAQRRVPDALGPYKLDMGDGYLIHGTHMYNETSIGEAVSHGCVRMDNTDLERLYRLVPRGTRVVIF
jgi:hypothetical protein